MSQPAGLDGPTAAVGTLSADELRIDDLRFQDLLRLALEEVPAASVGRWTLHGPVDPGVTLLELFAWQLEQRLFMAEQTTADVVRASLALLGVPGPAATRSARTVLCFAAAATPAELGAGTEVSLDADALGRRFSLDEPVTVLPVGTVEVVGRLLRPGDVVEFAHSYAGPRISAGRLSLLVDIDAAPGVAPAWGEAAVDVPPPAELVWTAVGPDGTEAAIGVEDGTGGLRRSGLLRLDWPPVWNAVGAGPCRLRATARQASYTEPPQIRGVHPNAAAASHLLRRTAQIGDQVGGLAPLPGQRLVLAGTAGLLLDGPGAVSLGVVEPGGAEHTWRSVSDWTAAGPADRVFVVDRVRGELVLGDGRAGRILRPNAGSPATVWYAIGGGEGGNLGSGRPWVRDGGAETATNPVPASGGADHEDLRASQQRAADDLALADRTVTVADAEQLALATPGVGLQRAHASLGLHPGFPCVPVPSALSVTVVPYAARGPVPTTWTRAPQPDTGALAATRAYLEARRLVGQEIFVLPTTYRRVSVVLTVSQTSRSRTLEASVRDALLRFLDPLEGGSDRRGWPFGGVVRPSALVGVVRGALGPEASVTDLSAALDDGTPTNCADLVIGTRELVWLADLQINWVGGVPTGGGLR